MGYFSPVTTRDIEALQAHCDIEALARLHILCSVALGVWLDDDDLTYVGDISRASAWDECARVIRELRDDDIPRPPDEYRAAIVALVLE